MLVPNCLNSTGTASGYATRPDDLAYPLRAFGHYCNKPNALNAARLARWTD